MIRRISAAIAFAMLAYHCGNGSEQPSGAAATDGGASSDGGGVSDGSGSKDGHPSSSGSAEGGGAEAGKPDGAGAHDSGSSSGGGSSGGPGVAIHVTNGCPLDLWIHAVGKEATLQPDNAHLAPGGTQTYQAPPTWTVARVYAYLDAPDAQGNPQGPNDKIEASFSANGGSESLNTDITYVDWVALPSEIQTIGTGSDCTTVGCEVPFADILTGCPPALLSAAGRECLSAGYHCLTTSNPGEPYCHALDSQIAACASQAACAGAAGSTTAQAYSCSGGFFGGNNEYCAALNRGVLSSPGPGTPPSAFYQSPPFNTYAQWVHQKCPGIYAFPYDDFGSSNQSSDHTCTGATQMNVTFCPKG